MFRVLLAISLLLAWPAETKQPRSQKVLREFQKLHPCPSTGFTAGKCPGYQKDHVVPLCFHGEDKVYNLQWLKVRDHKAKTRLDIKVCNWDR